MNKWDKRFLELALHVAEWSKDPSTKVGAVIVNDLNDVVSVGFNGFPRKVDDCPGRYLDKPTKYAMVVHAEANAILIAKRSAAGCILYSSLFTCNECAKLIIQSGIKRIVTFKPNKPHWENSFNFAKLMYQESGVEVIEYEREVDEKKGCKGIKEIRCPCS